MSTEAKNIRLDSTVLAALKEAAERENKTLDEMASEVVTAGLRSSSLARVQAIIAKGKQYGAKSGIREDEVVDVIHQER